MLRTLEKFPSGGLQTVTKWGLETDLLSMIETARTRLLGTGQGNDIPDMSY